MSLEEEEGVKRIQNNQRITIHVERNGHKLITKRSYSKAFEPFLSSINLRATIFICNIMRLARRISNTFMFPLLVAM